jgi:hypothetical protein
VEGREGLRGERETKTSIAVRRSETGKNTVKNSSREQVGQVSDLIFQNVSVTYGQVRDLTYHGHAGIW